MNTPCIYFRSRSNTCTFTAICPHKVFNLVERNLPTPTWKKNFPGYDVDWKRYPTCNRGGEMVVSDKSSNGAMGFRYVVKGGNDGF